MQRAIRDKLETVLARLAARAVDERVFLKVYHETACRQADAADERVAHGLSRGLLDGVLVSIKDVLDVAGDVTMAGSILRQHALPARVNALAVTRLLDAGAVIVGRTNLTEFCFTSEGINRHFGTPGNAYDASRIPGGSSSGAGVSVAEGTCEIAIGSDTGGSIRIPASLNGVVGFKPTASRMPMDGIFPLSHTLDSIGPLARTVAECAAADAVLAGEPLVALQPASLFGLRLGLPTGSLLNDLEPAVAAAFEQSMRSIQAAGGRIIEIGVDDLLSQLRAITRDGSIASVEAAAIHADWLIAGDTRVERRTREVLTQRLNYPAWRYLRMIERRNQLVAAMDHRLADIDAFILPTVPIVAPKIAPLLADDELADDVDGMLLRNPQIANQFDLTAISLPMPADGPPTGMMVVGRNRTDRRLLAIAAGVEGCLACV